MNFALSFELPKCKNCTLDCTLEENAVLAEIKLDSKITQKQIAEYLMCDQSLYSKYERGEREIPLNLIIKLADYYNVSLDYIVGRSAEK